MQFRIQLVSTVADNAEAIIQRCHRPLKFRRKCTRLLACPRRPRLEAAILTHLQRALTTTGRVAHYTAVKNKDDDRSVPVSPSVRRYALSCRRLSARMRLGASKNYFEHDAVDCSYSLTSFPIREEVLIAEVTWGQGWLNIKSDYIITDTRKTLSEVLLYWREKQRFSFFSMNFLLVKKTTSLMIGKFMKEFARMCLLQEKNGMLFRYSFHVWIQTVLMTNYDLTWIN